MKIKITKIAFILSFILSCVACSEDKLSGNSVIDENKTQIEATELDNWILNNITKPYGIEVIYRWEKNSNADGVYIYPPKIEKVRAVLEAVKELGLDTYLLKEVGGKDFLLGRLPIKLYLYGGGNPDENGVERLYNPQLTAAEMCIYNVNEFEPTDFDKVFVLMRSVHHQLAKRLMQFVSYDRDKFYAISGHRYTGTTEPIAAPLGYAKTGKERFGLDNYANKRGFYTMLSFLSAEDDFAEIISSTLTSTPKEVYDAGVAASTPDTDVDPEVNARYAKEAEQAYKEFIAKQTFVNEYVQKEWHINLKQMQVISVRRINNYINQH
jgi:hypothetical protein